MTNYIPARIGTTSPDEANAKLDVKGNIMVSGASWASGDSAYLYLGVGPVHYIKAKFGTGVQIGTFQAPDAITLRETTGYVGIGEANPATKLELAEAKTIAGTTSDGYSAGLTLDPEYSAASAQTVTRHNYIDVNNPGTTNVTITNAAVMRFDAAAGTHKAVDSGTTKASPGTVNAWLKVNINGTIYYIPTYTSKTA